MIIELILGVIYKVFDLLLILEIPSLPAQVQQYLSVFFSYMETGAGIIANYTHFSYVMTLFFLALAVEAGVLIYHFVMWIIRKIPMAGIS